jgi:pSer/pThr/pTyr-binding forkhead associated (FHA) protein
VPFPQQTPGVSRVHLKIWPQNGKLLSMDMGSRYGSWINNNKMVPGLVYALEEGTTLFFGDDQEFRVVRDYQDRSTAYTAPYMQTLY